MSRTKVTLDGNEAAAYVAHRTNEVIAIYPITPSSPMGESADEWASRLIPNIWGTVPSVIEMQSEGGAAGAVHGSLQAGSLTTTFTSSQGLLLMIPNMFKIAGELTSTVFHIAARSLAAQALSIFGDHSDVMAARSTGWGMLFASSVQEVMDFALVSQAATLESRVPFMHVFDGFRTSHEVQKVERLDDDQMRSMISQELVQEHRRRALTPDRPVLRGTAQNPDVYFQARERANPFYDATPQIVQGAFDRFAKLTGRQYRLFEYSGAPDAERVIIVMGSGIETVEETVKSLVAKGEKVGVLKVRLYRPFAANAFLEALPKTVRTIGVLDRTKEPGASGEPLYQDVVTVIAEAIDTGAVHLIQRPRVLGGRYGLSSKEFTPAMVASVFRNLSAPNPRNHFTIGIHDDITGSSLDFDAAWDIEDPDAVRAVFWGLGSDGTVGANKNSIKIIGEETENYAQGYFVYDSKKAGAVTISYLRFGPRPIRAPYLIRRASFVAVHQFGFVDRYNVLEAADNDAVLLINTPMSQEEFWDRLPRSMQEEIIEKRIRVYTIDAYTVARANGMGVRINTIMQTCFFAISGVLPREEAIQKIKEAIKKTYGKRGESVVKMNYAAVDATLEHLHEFTVPSSASSSVVMALPVPERAPGFVQSVTGEIIAGRGDDLPVSCMPVDGTFPTATARWEKRCIALDVPVWETDLCIQCGKCVMVCPHACIRSKTYDVTLAASAPPTFKRQEAKWRELPGKSYSIQVSVEDCTGCKLCVEICPAKDKTNVSRKALNMAPIEPLKIPERANWEFFLELPDMDRATTPLKFNNVKDTSLLTPLFEFSGACAGCGETPYLTLLSRLYGDRTVIANATGCSSIYGGNLPTTPWAQNREGRGPAWSNSLFEDNAEFGLGMRLAIDKQEAYARELVRKHASTIGDAFVRELLEADQKTEEGVRAQRERVRLLRERLAVSHDPVTLDLVQVADALVRKNVWIIGGDGWAYDIGFGGLDHVISTGRNVNILVLDTEVYSNTGGQASKATPLGAVAKFAAGGKPRAKKDLGMMAMSYGNVYVASIAMGAKDVQTVLALLEAEAWDGPSIIIAYSHCIAHGIDMSKGLDQQRKAVASGQWPLYRFNPALAAAGKNPLIVDYGEPKLPLKDYMEAESRFRVLSSINASAAEAFMRASEEANREHWKTLNRMSQAPAAGAGPAAAVAAPVASTPKKEA